MKFISILHPANLIVITLLILTSCQSKNDNSKPLENEQDELGQLSLKVTGNEKAQKEFKTGLLLLHSFEYEDAREAFQKAQKADSTMAMAYWGEAMTHNHSLWQRQEKEEAIKALNKLSEDAEDRVGFAKTEFEKDLLRATNILYGDGTKYERDITYENFMSSLVEKHPNNNEIKAFHAISLLAASRNGRDESLYNRCAQIAQGIIKENPHHPGALHYLIHAYDDPGHAHMAKTAADAYSKVAPDATHALHMPSHIYVALGQWNDVIKSNIASWNASVKKENKSYHALHWLEYGFLQKGELENAKVVLDKMISISKEDSTKVARGYLNNMIGAYLVASNDWNNANLHLNYKTDDLNLTTRTSNKYIKGMKALTQKRNEKLKSIISDIGKDIYAASLALGEKTFAMCSSGGFANKPANQLDIDMCKIMESQLKAKLALLENKPQRAIKILDKAVALDMTLSYSYGPPVILKPVYEDYAETLLQLKEYEKANLVFNKSLERNPLRLKSLQGQKDILQILKKQEELASIERQLNDVLTKIEYAEIL